MLVDLSGLGLLTDEIKDRVNITVKLKGRPMDQRPGLVPDVTLSYRNKNALIGGALTDSWFWPPVACAYI
jgi:hypothetical protein